MDRIFLIEALIVLLYMTSCFLIAQGKKRNDIADIAWGPGFILTAVTALLLNEVWTLRALLTTSLVLAWGMRLALHVYLRNRGRPEDERYRKWREGWGSHPLIGAYLQVFLLQGVFLLVISAPVIMINSSPESPLNLLDALGILLWLTGFAFETAGDLQLSRFRRDPARRGKIMTGGLWKYTRHPNYFGEVVLWWGIYIIALSVPSGWTTLIGPLTISLLILRVSGIPLLEKKYEGNPEYEAYRRRTSAFFPLPPRKET